jgi:mono/diheme cytochrome c family protein
VREGPLTGHTRQRMLAALAFGALFWSCDNRQAFHRPTPGLERMLVQARATPYGASSAFVDGRVMRTPPPDTISRERPWAGDLAAETGQTAAGFVERISLPVTVPLLQSGHAAFDRVCATCHGVLGDGHSVVADKMELRKPPSLHEPRIAALAPGKIFAVLSNGYGLMPGFASILTVDERWAVVAYLDALRLSQAAPVATLPDSIRRELAREAP